MYTKCYTLVIADVLCTIQKSPYFQAHPTLEQAECQNLKQRRSKLSR